MEFIVILACATLLWLIWQLIKAKKFTKFKQLLEQEIKPKVEAHIINELNETRSDLFPNTAIHQQATLFYWSQYKSRILVAALKREIIDEAWLKNTGNLRNSQHLLFIEKNKIADCY